MIVAPRLLIGHADHGPTEWGSRKIPPDTT